MGTCTRLVLALFAIFLTAQALPTLPILKKMYSEFKTKYGRQSQSAAEEEFRFDIFQNRLKKIEELNKAAAGNVTYGITKFADWTREERSRLLSSKPPVHRNLLQSPNVPLKAAPESWDWRSNGGVSKVKDQGDCGSCWAFSATAVVESVHKIHDGVELDLSEQFLVNCDKESAGCDGGWYDTALAVVVAKGQLLESELPYKAVDGRCPSSSTGSTKISKVVSVSSNADSIASWVAANAPVAVYYGVPESFFDYVSGIYNPSVSECLESNVAGYHAVQVVGYGVENNVKYWIVKNSWSSTWGENGFFKIVRGVDACEIEELPVGAEV